MPKNQVTDPITDQEIDFARLVLSGTMTDRCAAGAAGLNPDTAAYTKAKLAAYLQDHQAPVQQQFVAQDTTEPRRFTVTRDQVLTRLWEIAAIEGLIPDRRAASAQNKPAPPPSTVDFYESEWLRARRTGETVEPPPAVPQEEPASGPSSGSAPPTQEPTHAPTPSCAPRVPMADHVAPDTRVPFSIKPWRR